MKNDRKKHRKWLLLLLLLLFFFAIGTATYATVTGQIPRIFGGYRGPQNIAALQVSDGKEPISQIDPSEINSTDTIDHSSSESSVDPDAPVTSEDQTVNIGTATNTGMNPIPITTSSDTTSTPSSPASHPTSSAPVSSKPTSSAPASSAATSSTPTSSAPVSSSPNSGGKSTGGGGGSKSYPITAVTLDKADITLNKGDTSGSLLATISPANTTGSKTLTWVSKNPAIATVDNTGKVTAVGAGNTEVGVTTSNGKTASCTVTVLVPPTDIKINSDNFSLDKGSSKTLTATVEPEDCTDKSVVWATSNSDIISVDENGKVIAENIGTAKITATTADGKIMASCDVTGVIPIASLKLDQSELSMIKGTDQTLTATIDPPDTTDEKTIAWGSTNPAVATVDSFGKITAVARGMTVISAQVGSHVAECTVTVTVPATGITLNKSNTTIVKGTDETLKVTIFPEDTTNIEVGWTSTDESVATVDGTGKVTAVSVGSTIITATSHDGGYTAQCNVTVVIPVTGVTLNKSELHLIKGNGAALIAAISPVDATDQAVTWSTSNPLVATVDNTGHITTVGGGTVTISVKTHDGDFSASCSVTVTVPVSGISLDKTTLTLIKGTNGKLTAAFAPEDATDKNVIWSSSDSNVCTVDDAGNLTALNSGTAVITAKSEDGGFTAQCNVHVNVPVAGLKIMDTYGHDNTGIVAYNSIWMDGTQQLKAVVSPSDADDKSVIWWSSDPDAISVDENGLVKGTGNGIGTYTIYCKTNSGNYEAFTKIHVYGGTIMGSLKDESTGEWIEGATVKVSLDGVLIDQTVTDSSGEFGFSRDFYAKNYTVEISKPGYVSEVFTLPVTDRGHVYSWLLSKEDGVYFATSGDRYSLWSGGGTNGATQSIDADGTVFLQTPMNQQGLRGAKAGICIDLKTPITMAAASDSTVTVEVGGDMESTGTMGGGADLWVKDNNWTTVGWYSGFNSWPVKPVSFSPVNVGQGQGPVSEHQITQLYIVLDNEQASWNDTYGLILHRGATIKILTTSGYYTVTL